MSREMSPKSFGWFFVFFGRGEFISSFFIVRDVKRVTNGMYICIICKGGGNTPFSLLLISCVKERAGGGETG